MTENKTNKRVKDVQYSQYLTRLSQVLRTDSFLLKHFLFQSPDTNCLILHMLLGN